MSEQDEIYVFGDLHTEVLVSGAQLGSWQDRLAQIQSLITEKYEEIVGLEEQKRELEKLVSAVQILSTPP